MRRSGARSFRMRWNRGDAMTTHRDRGALGTGARPPDGPPRPDGPRKTGLHGSGGGAGRAGKRGRPQSVHVPFPSWIAAGGTRCIHQVRE